MFGEFLDDLQSVPMDETIGQTAAELCGVLASFYGHEDEYRDSVNTVLSRYLGVSFEPTDFVAGSTCDGSWCIDIQGHRLVSFLSQISEVHCGQRFIQALAEQACVT